MLRLGDLDLTSGPPKVAVSFTDVDARGDLAVAREAGVEIAELRIDLFARLTPDYVALQAERLTGLATIATIRLAEEGGAWKGAEAARLALYEEVMPLVDGIDVELRATGTLAALAPRARVKSGSIAAGDYDWGGAASTIFWVDPVEDLSVVFMTQLMPSGAFNFRGQLKSIIYSSIVA